MIPAALITSLGSIGASALSAISQRNQNKQNVATAKDLMDYQYNNFQSPLAQMAAYKSAGINPFAQGSIQSESPSAQIPDQQAPGSLFSSTLSSLIEPLSSLATMNANFVKLQSEIDSQNLSNKLAELDLGEFKPRELEELNKRIESLDVGNKLTEKNISKVAEEILKYKAEIRGLTLDNVKKRYDIYQNDVFFKNGVPESLAKLSNAQLRRLQQEITIDESRELSGVFDRNYWKNLNDFQREFEKFKIEDYLGTLPHPMKRLAAPVLRAMIYGMLKQLTSLGSDPLEYFNKIKSTFTIP